ncbi:type I-E CRISPR-associated protein Cas6/Cse3/CasE [Deinococcus aluminii]|uniref:CRISPR-associated endoribonuclease Cse3 n=1 Tax=Deinococcus aluminii TaxID=1656885 RepID=A0ABP9XDI2_9DEIO
MTALHLSRLSLNPASEQAARDRRSPYALHQMLRWAFPGAGVEGGQLPRGERLLWRLEERALLVQSVTAPDWGALNARLPGYLERWDMGVLNLAGSLRPGRPLRFRLRANVTVRRPTLHEGDAAPKSRRHAVRGPHEQLDWLARQGERHGFDLLDADIPHSGTLKTRKGGATITLHTVTFEGVLRVTDPDALAVAVRGGLGHAKALGCGLLSLLPA